MATTSKKNSPTHIAYMVKEGAQDSNFWTRIGAAWAHNDGNGFSLQLDAFPIDGRITLRVPSTKEDKEEGAAS